MVILLDSAHLFRTPHAKAAYPEFCGATDLGRIFRNRDVAV
jgi:hypothetical protein